MDIYRDIYRDMFAHSIMTLYKKIARCVKQKAWCFGKNRQKIPNKDKLWQK